MVYICIVTLHESLAMRDWTFANGEAYAFVQSGNDMLLNLAFNVNHQKLYQATQPYQSIKGKVLSANMIGIQIRNATKQEKKTQGNSNTPVNANSALDNV